MLEQDEVADQADYNSDGDTDDCVLGYFNTATETAVNANIPVVNASMGGDVIAYHHADTGTLGYYLISSSTATDTGIVPACFSNNDSNHFVSSGRIAYVTETSDLNGDGAPDYELNIYNTGTRQNTPTGATRIDPCSFHPSFSGDLVAYQTAGETIGYYNAATGQTTDTGIPGYEPAIDNGTIVFMSPSGFVAYYVVATDKFVLTPMPTNGGDMPSISNGIIAVSGNEGYWGDLNGDLDVWDPVGLLYDIPTGRMMSTGLTKYHWGEVTNEIVQCRSHETDLNQDLNGDGDLEDVVHVYQILDDVAKGYFGR
jgi:hypothetical protein